MKSTRLISLLLAVAAQTVMADEVRLFRADEMPDPREVAAILDGDASRARPIKLRGIRIAPDQTASVESWAKPADGDGGPTGFALAVQFAYNSTRILPGATQQLDAIAEGIKLAGVGAGAKVVIEGHTDAFGRAEYNEQLSHRRAEAVKAYLVLHHGIAPNRLRTVGMGMNRPYNVADPFAAENRRVEFRAAPGGSREPS